jgi:hemerythrin-like metal-binding protein
MSTFNWSDKLSIGVKEMDDQHKKLISKINDLMDNIDKSSNQEVLSQYTSLGDYVVKHFKEEELFMESINYDGLASHKIIHKKLLDQLGEFADQIKNDTLDSQKLFSFLELWLKSHIMGIDAKYGEVANSKAA